jgi:hypothetical protein
MLAGMTNYFIGYYVADRARRKEVASIVGKDVKKIKDLSFDNFKAITESDYKEEEYDNDFTIEHYPESKKYYPKYKKYYLKEEYTTGIVSKEDSMNWADSAKSEEGALKMIELFKEQKLKKNVTTIKVKK